MIKNLLTLTFVITQRNKRLTSKTNQSINDEITRLNALFEMLDMNVYLVGGIGMAIRENRFYRNHRDLDIAIFTDDIVCFFEHMQTKGYRILQKHASGHISPKHNLQIGSEISIDEIERTDPELLKIRLLKSNNTGINRIKRRTDFFDVFFLGKTTKGVVLHGYGAFTPWSDFNPIYPVTEGAKLLLPNINYKRYLHPKNHKEILDFQMCGLIPA